MIIAGIDPGKTGALSILFPDDSAIILDVSVQKLRGKSHPAWSQWVNEWTSAICLAEPDLFVIEDVASRPTQGVSSVFKFGRSFGFAHGIAATAGKPIHFVTPSVWKGKLGLLKSDKNASREMASQLFPKIAGNLARVKDDGRAEATLLALYGRRHLTI